MPIDQHLVTQASYPGKILFKWDDSEILGSADGILVFRFHLQDFIQQNPKSQIPLSSISDIIYDLESNPDPTLQTKDVRTRLINLFAKVAQHQALD